MAFTKKEKNQMVAQYTQWLNESQGVFMLEFDRMSVKEIESLRAKVREVGGQAHVVKNTLMKLAMQQAGLEEEGALLGTTLVGFAFQDAPALAKVLSEATKSDMFAIKRGYLERQKISIDQVKALAELPSLPVMQATLLGVIMAPATKLVRTLVEPARQVAAVVKAYSENVASPEALPPAA